MLNLIVIPVNIVIIIYLPLGFYNRQEKKHKAEKFTLDNY